MKMSEHGKQLLSEWEGNEKKVYKDVAGYQTIGVGHLLTEQERNSAKILIAGEEVDYADGLSSAQVMDLLTQDLERFEQTVTNNVTVELDQNQFDALVAFCFNVGTGAFQQSTLLKELNKGNYEGIPGQLKRWINAGGKPVDGLIARRNKEIALWNA